MEVTSARENLTTGGGSYVTEAASQQYKSADVRDSPPAERHHSVRGNDSDCDRPPPSVERPHIPSVNESHPVIPESVSDSHVGGDERSVGRRHPDKRLVERRGAHRGRRHQAVDSYRDGMTSLREESARGGYERAWHALSGYERATSPIYDSAPHPISGYERLSVERAHTMKDFEKQITELKKENFNLKLRIYFLEEQVQRRGESSSDELHRLNIELKVEVESLKHDYTEKHNLLLRASKAMESLAGEHDLAIQRLRQEHRKQLRDMEDVNSQRIRRLETEREQEKAELEKICALLDQERRFNAEERLLALKDQYSKSVGVLEERDWIIQCLNETVRSKDALIAQLEKQIASMMPYEASGDQTDERTGHLYLQSDAKHLPEAPEPLCNVDDQEENVNEWQKKIKEMDSLIYELQQKLQDNKARIAAEEKNSLKRDKAIQGLTLALKKKAKENDKLLQDVHHLNAALSEAKEGARQLQSVKENIHPDYKKVIFTLQAEQDVYSRLVKYERESGGLQEELESIAMLRRWLEENIQANQELRKIMEAQIMAKYNGDDTLSFLGDQTSYFSICLDHLDQNEYFFAGGPQRITMSKNDLPIGEAAEANLVLREEAGTQTQSPVPSSGNIKNQQDYRLDLSLDEWSTLMGGDGGNDAKPTRNKQIPVSSATQTELGGFSDQSIAANVSRVLKERAELMWIQQDGELDNRSEKLPDKRNNYTCNKRGEVYNFNQDAKRSRLPVLLKSSLNTKLKTEATLTLGEENDHSQKELQIISRLYEQLKCAEMEVESLKENKELASENHRPDRNNPSQEQRDSIEQELRLENHRLTEQSKRAENEIQTLKANEELWRCKESDRKTSRTRESTERASQENLPAESYRLSEQLKQSQVEIETLKAHEELLKYKDTSPHSSTPRNVQSESTDQTLQKELQAENYRLSEKLKHAEVEIETLKAKEELITHKDTAPGVSYPFKDQKEDQALQKELQAENYRLSEQLKQAEVEIETLKAKEELITHKDTAPGISYPFKDQKELQAENNRLSEQLKTAQMEIETLKANEDFIRCEESGINNSKQSKSTERALQKELQAENYRLSEQLKQAEVEIETLKPKEELITHKDTAPGVSYPFKDQKEDQALQKELQAENYRLSEQLKQAEVEIETLKAKEELITHKDTAPGISYPFKDQKEDQALQKELQAENYRLSEQLKHAEVEIETLKANEDFFRCQESDANNSKQSESTEQALQKELQAENYRLSEKLKHAEVEIETLKAKEDFFRCQESDINNAKQSESTERALHKELQAENYRLSTQLKNTQVEIEKLQAEGRLTDSSDDSLKLHGSDAEDDLSEQSFLDKTVTNSVNVNEVDAASDFGDEVSRPNVNSQNAVALRCHHDNHCAECANNREITSLPTSNSKRASTMHTSTTFTKVSCSGRSFEDTTSLSKYDLLVQSQARELSLQRQKIKESHNLSVICSKNFYNILKAFQNFFPAGALDSNMTLGFQEQLTQTVEWLKELEYKLSDAFYGEEDAYSDHSADGLLYTPSRLVPGHRMWADKHGCHVLGLVEDYNALRKQILEARNVLQEVETFIDHGVQTAVLNMTEHFGDIFYEKFTRAKQSLEEAGCLLKLLWRVSLPLRIHSPYSINQEEEVNLETTRLRKRVLEQEKLLSGMVKRVYSENQMKEDIEKLILDQLAMTHDILKKAKGNLEVQVVDKIL
ncbi:uncharacterized protein LOC142741950 [Rhinoderma darwinii]|uniref:uncharacterized protein LOC142741950 n=1 Tax=Rhinoderma darwinii TaxID=43563 RepID=UPI003F66DAE5